MTSLIVILVAALLALILALRAARVLRRQRTPTLADLEILFESGPDRYAHLGRILGHEDFDFLGGSRRGAVFLGRLRKQRIRSMRRYLRQMEEDFQSLMAVGALFATAPSAQSERFALRLARQRLRFHWLLLSLKARTFANYAFDWPLEVAHLGTEIQTLRRQADRVLHALTPEDLCAIRSFLRSS